MLRSSIKRAAAVAVMVSGMVLGGAVKPAAADPVLLPAGLACDFDITLDSGIDSRSYHEFKNADGNVVRFFLAGRGNAVTFTNTEADPQVTLSLRANGSMWNVVNHPDGTSTWTTHGHLVLILFPTDIPAGPSTTLYVGRVMFNVDNQTGVFTLLGNQGTATDLCAALSG